MAAQSEFLRLEGLSKRFKDVLALDRVSFGIRRGEIFGYIGPNGAGKTTTIKIIVGLLRDFQGTVYLVGRSVTDHATEIQRLLGYLPQKAAFQDWRTVEQALMTFGQLNGMSRQDLDRRIPEVLGLLGIPDVQHRKIVHLSGGTVQKLGMAQAILHEPELLVLDEPMSGLDPTSRFQFKALFKELRKEGTTIFFSSHILSDVQDIANRVGILNQGRTMHVGTLEELKASLGVPKQAGVVLSADNGGWRTITYLAGVDQIEQPEPGRLAIRLAADADVDETIDALIDALKRVGCRIRSIYPVTPDLEQLYVQFVGRAGGA